MASSTIDTAESFRTAVHNFIAISMGIRPSGMTDLEVEELLDEMTRGSISPRTAIALMVLGGEKRGDATGVQSHRTYLGSNRRKGLRQSVLRRRWRARSSFRNRTDATAARFRREIEAVEGPASVPRYRAGIAIWPGRCTARQEHHQTAAVDGGDGGKVVERLAHYLAGYAPHRPVHQQRLRVMQHVAE